MINKKSIKVAEELLKAEKEIRDNMEDWFDTGLLDYLENNFDKWLVNPINNNIVEIFIELDNEEQAFDESYYMAIDYVNSIDIDLNKLPEYYIGRTIDLATENFLVYSITELGDEPINNTVHYSPNLMEEE